MPRPSLKPVTVVGAQGREGVDVEGMGGVGVDADSDGEEEVARNDVNLEDESEFSFGYRIVCLIG